MPEPPRHESTGRLVQCGQHDLPKGIPFLPHRPGKGGAGGEAESDLYGRQGGEQEHRPAQRGTVAVPQERDGDEPEHRAGREERAQHVRIDRPLLVPQLGAENHLQVNCDEGREGAHRKALDSLPGLRRSRRVAGGEVGQGHHEGEEGLTEATVHEGKGAGDLGDPQAAQQTLQTDRRDGGPAENPHQFPVPLPAVQRDGE
jgi:hypothetical protein